MILALLPAGCSTSVHLYTQGLEESAVVKLKQALDAEGYKTHLNARQVPREVNWPTLVYSPEHRDHRQLRELHRFLSELGYDVRLEPVAIGNHFYTRNNVGLYLKTWSEVAPRQGAEGAGQREEVGLAGLEFAGECSRVDAALQLNAGHVYTLEVITWDESSQQEIIRSSSGIWAQEGDAVFLEDGRNEIRLGVEHFTDRYEVPEKPFPRIVETDGIRLRNGGDALQGCDFVIRYTGQL